jgi:hypothetical protein
MIERILIGVANGNDLVAPTMISGSVALATGGTASIDSVGNTNRAALLEANGYIYVALARTAYQGTSHIHGWVVVYGAANLQDTGNLLDLTNANNGDNYFLGSPWMSGFGPASAAQDYSYFATGNGPFDGKSNFSQSAMKVPGNLKLAGASFFTPIQADAASDGDNDLASGGVMLLPDQARSLPHLRKSQVTVEYDGDQPVRVDTVVISTQQDPDVLLEVIRHEVTEGSSTKSFPEVCSTTICACS